MPVDWLGLIPVLILAGGGVLIFCVGAFGPRGAGDLLCALALLTAVAAGVVTLVVAPHQSSSEFMLDVSGYARYFTFLFSAITVVTILFLRQYARVRGFAGDELYGLLLLAAAGMVLVAGAINWVVFFLGLELLSLALYVLIAVRQGHASSLEASLKYFIMGAVASAFLIFGIALLFAMSGTLGVFGTLVAGPAGFAFPQNMAVVLLALALILVGIGFKISLVPFHLWTPDVYQGAPAPITAFLSTGSKVAIFAALLRFSLVLADRAWIYCIPWIWGLAALTMVVGNLTALYQTRVKRLLAYSSIGQMGYLLMTLLAVKQGGQPVLMFYLTVYAIMDLGAFGLIGSFSAAQTDPDLDELQDYQGLGYSQPWRAAIFAVCLISLAGLPPTAGFMGKLALFQAVLDANFVVLAVIGILTVIISLYYYMKVVVVMYMAPAPAGVTVPAADFSVRLAGALILVLILWLGLAPSPLLNLFSRIAATMSLI